MRTIDHFNSNHFKSFIKILFSVLKLFFNKMDVITKVMIILTLISSTQILRIQFQP